MNWTEKEYDDYLRKKGINPRHNKIKAIKEIKEIKEIKKSKYNNIKTTVDDIEFDSQMEADYYCQLKLLKRAGEIKDFALQQRFELLPSFKKNGKLHRAITYIADFVIENNDGTTEVVDTKGVETKDFKIKQKLFEYRYENLHLKIVK